jgi:hypothetical protein
MDSVWAIQPKSLYGVARDWVAPYHFITAKYVVISSNPASKSWIAGGSTLMLCGISKTIYRRINSIA